MRIRFIGPVINDLFYFPELCRIGRKKDRGILPDDQGIIKTGTWFPVSKRPTGGIGSRAVLFWVLAGAGAGRDH